MAHSNKEGEMGRRILWSPATTKILRIWFCGGSGSCLEGTKAKGGMGRKASENPVGDSFKLGCQELNWKGL